MITLTLTMERAEQLGFVVCKHCGVARKYHSKYPNGLIRCVWHNSTYTPVVPDGVVLTKVRRKKEV